jgi:nucleoside-diphosphate-sugar epimerase
VTDNAAMTTLVAKACGETNVPLCYASTSEVYGNGGERSWIESDLYERDPINLYGLSKRWGEEACRLYAPNDLTILRISMPYGPGLPPGEGRAAIMNFLWSALNREPITVHKGAARSWCFVSDTVRGIRMILESKRHGAWNVGRDDAAVWMEGLAEMACDLVGAPHSLIHEVDPPDWGQIVVKRLSDGRLRTLGWKPEVSLVKGMSRALDWLQGYEELAA